MINSALSAVNSPLSAERYFRLSLDVGVLSENVETSSAVTTMSSFSDFKSWLKETRFLREFFERELLEEPPLLSESDRDRDLDLREPRVDPDADDLVRSNDRDLERDTFFGIGSFDRCLNAPTLLPSAATPLPTAALCESFIRIVFLTTGVVILSTARTTRVFGLDPRGRNSQRLRRLAFSNFRSSVTGVGDDFFAFFFLVAIFLL